MKRLLFVAGFVIVVVIGGVLMGLHHNNRMDPDEPIRDRNKS